MGRLEQLKTLLGEPTKVFSTGIWWDHVSRDLALQAKEIDSEIHLSSVYAYPDKVEGGQRWDICLPIEVKETSKEVTRMEDDVKKANPLYNGDFDVVGSYGRDYTRQVDILMDWLRDKDFTIIATGQQINRSNAEKYLRNGCWVNLRYSQRAKMIPVQVASKNF